MDYVTTNIRLPEKDWKAYKLQALEEKKSLSAWIRNSLQEKMKMGNNLVSKEFSSWSKNFVKKYRPMLKELAKK